MKFKFDVNLTDQDYLDYNVFWQLKSPYGEKHVKNLRIFSAIILLLVIISSLVANGFSSDFIYPEIMLLIVTVLWIVFVPRLFVSSIKTHIKSLKKKGKMGYTTLSTMEFYDDRLVEITQLQKTELNYTAIERISIYENRVIYIHISNVAAIIIPRTCFDSPKEYVCFIEFLKSKNGNIQCY